MALAGEERHRATRGEGPLGRAAPDEPVFILRARDMFAPHAVREWLAELERSGLANEGKLDEARNLLSAMCAWQIQHGCKVPD